jgi:hypothetical protein
MCFRHIIGPAGARITYGGGGELHTAFWCRNLGRQRRRCEDNIKMDVGSEMRGMDWIDLTQNMNRWRALVNGVTNSRVP